MPRDEHSIALAAKNSRVLAIDNLSHLSGDQSDSLCRISTGGGLSARKLYTDEDEVLIQYCRPIILNGIGDVVARGDW